MIKRTILTLLTITLCTSANIYSMDIFKAIKENNTKQVKKILENKNFDINKPNKNNRTPLYYTLLKTSKENLAPKLNIINLLLENGAQIDKKTIRIMDSEKWNISKNIKSYINGIIKTVNAYYFQKKRGIAANFITTLDSPNHKLRQNAPLLIKIAFHKLEEIINNKSTSTNNKISLIRNSVFYKLYQKMNKKHLEEILNKPTMIFDFIETLEKQKKIKKIKKIKKKQMTPKKFVSVAIFLNKLNKKPKKYSPQQYDLASNEGTSLALKKPHIKAITAELIIAINDKINVIIASSCLMQNLLYLNDKKNIKSFHPDNINVIKKLKKIMKNLFEHWKVYKTKDKQFCIFIQKPNFDNVNLKKLGLNNDILSQIKNLDELRNNFATPKGPIYSIDVNKLNNIFKGYIPKFVYITGHGSTSEKTTSQEPTKIGKSLFKDISIAQLTHSQNNKFLKKMNKTGCYFLYYNSCFIGGLNTLLINKIITKKLNELVNKSIITFPIVSGGLTDSTTLLFRDINFNTFFQRLRIFFKKRITKETPIKSISWIEKPFKNIVLPICGLNLKNTPSILFPGLDRPLKTINVDEEVIALTYPYLIAHELGIKNKEYKEIMFKRGEKKKIESKIKDIEKRYKRAQIKERKRIKELKKSREKQQELDSEITKEKRKETSDFWEKRQNVLKEELQKELDKIKTAGKLEKRKIKPIEIGWKKAVLLYPMILNVPLKITDKRRIPKIISMIPGKAYHYIHKIDIGDHDILDFINKAFKIEDQSASKLFFIKEVITKSKHIKSMFILKKGENNIQLFIKFKSGNWIEIIYKYIEKDLKWSTIKDSIINAKNIKEIVKEFQSQVEPLKEALFATSVIENKKQFDKLIDNEFLNSNFNDTVTENELFEELKHYKGKNQEIYLTVYGAIKDRRETKKPFSLKKMFKLSIKDDLHENNPIMKAIIRIIFEAYETKLLKDYQKSQEIRNVLKLSGKKFDRFKDLMLEKLKSKTKLDLSYKKLTTLPKKTFKLKTLTKLNLSYNQLTTLPKKIGDLINLTLLNLSYNQLTTLPKEIDQLQNLTLLKLNNNKLTTLPKKICDLINLTLLNLSYNQLTTLPPQIVKLKNLTLLKLNKNQLTTLPKEIGQLKNLTLLDLSNNQLTTLPPQIGKLKNLTLLDLSYNKLTTLPPQIGQLESLTQLNLNKNQLITLPSQIDQLKNLTILNLSDNKLIALPKEIGQLQNLTQLNLSDNQLKTLPKEIGQLKNLTQLNLSYNKLTTLPKSFKNLKELKVLHINKSKLDEKSKNLLKEIKNLQIWDL